MLISGSCVYYYEKEFSQNFGIISAGPIYLATLIKILIYLFLLILPSNIALQFAIRFGRNWMV